MNGNIAAGHRWNGAVTTDEVNIGKPDANGKWGNGSAYISFKDSPQNAGVNAGTGIAFQPHDWGLASKEAMRITGSGNVGISTLTPSEKLEVIGNVKATKFIGDGSGLTGLDLSKWSDGTGGIHYSSGNVGIGTITPVGTLSLGNYLGGTVGSSVSTYPKQMIVAGDYNAGVNLKGIKLLISDFSNDSGHDIYPIFVEDENNQVNFFIRSTGVGQDRANRTMFFNGNYGIGTTTPSTSLDIAGTVRIRGGSPATGRVLTSSANGTASWQIPDNSSWTESTNYVSTDKAVKAPSFHDSQNTGFYMNPASTSVLNVANISVIRDRESSSFYLDPNGNSNLNHLHAIKSYTGDSYSYRYYDRNSSGYYLDPASTSVLNIANISYINDRNDTRFRLDPNGTSTLNTLYSSTSHAYRYYDRNSSGYYLEPGNISYLNQARIRYIYDLDNTAYYLDPSGNSNLKTLHTGNSHTINSYASNSYSHRYYDRSNSSYYLDSASESRLYSARIRWLYDADNTGYYLDLDRTTKLNLLQIVGGSPGAGKVLTSDSSGIASWQSAGVSDNLGNHTATTSLNMNGNDIIKSANVNFLNYGQGLVGLYSSTRYQGVFSMGNAYKMAANGTSPGNLYGLAWTHSNVGGESIAGLGHQMLIMSNGDTRSAIGDGIWTKYGITGNTITSNGEYKSDGNTVIDNNGGWHRSYGNTGWLNGTHGGGWYMTDSIWIRTYGRKGIYVSSGTSGDAIMVLEADTDNNNEYDNSMIEFRQDDGGIRTWIGLDYNSYKDGGRVNDNALKLRGNDHDNAGIQFTLGNNERTNHFVAMDINPNGRIGVGTTTPSKKFYVNGSAGGTTGWNASDMRWKKGIQTISNALDGIMKIRGVQYDWKNASVDESTGFDDKTHYGVIAQEVEAVFPNLVDNSGNTEEYKHVEYNGFVGILIEAVKELKTENDVAKSENTQLRQELLALKSRQAAIEDMLLALSTDLPKEKLAKLSDVQ